MNIAPIINETEFHSVCASIADGFERIAFYLKDELEKDSLRLDVPAFKKRQNNFEYLMELTATITNGRTRMMETNFNQTEVNK